jgi:hypothetical protein
MCVAWLGAQMACGDKKACPKGGRPEYRNGPQYELVFGKRQGDRMKKKNEKACGHGSFAEAPCVFTTIEQKVSALRKWYDDVLKDTEIANPARNYRIENMLKTMAAKLGRGRKHVPKALQLSMLQAILETVDLDDTEEVLIAAYMSKNVVRGKRAEDESKLDWSNVRYVEGDAQGGKQGLAFDYPASKNNREQAERANPLHCTAGCKGLVERDETGKLVFASFCPVHLLLYAKTLQARDAGVDVHRLRGPLWGKYRRIEKVPSGTTLVASDVESQAHKAKALVMVVTRAQEAAGLFYNGSVPFIVNGRAYRPPCRGVWFEVAGTGYAVHAWASAGGVTHRMRQQMRLANRRSESEVIPEADIQQMSSKSHRIAMATLLLRKGCSAAEVVEIGEWEDEAMMRTYVEVLAPFAAERRNVTDVMYDAAFTGAQAARVLGEAATGTPSSSDAAVAVGTTPAVESVAAVVTAVLDTLSAGTRVRLERVLDPTDRAVEGASVAQSEAAVEQVQATELVQPIDHTMAVSGTTSSDATSSDSTSSHAPAADVRAATANVSAHLGIGADVASLTAEAGAAATALSGVAGAMAGSSAAAQASAPPTRVLGKRPEREKSEYKQCCKKHEGMPSALKQCRVEGDAALQQLLRETAELKPKACLQRLCAADYPVTRKEVMNYRTRKAETARCSTLPAVDVSDLAQALGM